MKQFGGSVVRVSGARLERRGCKREREKIDARQFLLHIQSGLVPWYDFTMLYLDRVIHEGLARTVELLVQHLRRQKNHHGRI